MAVCVKVDGTAVDAVGVGVDIGRGRHVHVEPVGLDVERRRLVHLLQDVAVEEGPVECHVVQVDQRRPVPVPDPVQQLVVDRKLRHGVSPQHQLLPGLGAAVLLVHGPHVVVDLVEVVVPHPGELALPVHVSQDGRQHDEQECGEHDQEWREWSRRSRFRQKG